MTSVAWYNMPILYISFTNEYNIYILYIYIYLYIKFFISLDRNNCNYDAFVLYFYCVPFLFSNNPTRGSLVIFLYKNKIYLTVIIDKHNTKIKYSDCFSPKSPKIIYIGDVRLSAITSYNISQISQRKATLELAGKREIYDPCKFVCKKLLFLRAMFFSLMKLGWRE